MEWRARLFVPSGVSSLYEVLLQAFMPLKWWICCFDLKKRSGSEFLSRDPAKV